MLVFLDWFFTLFHALFTLFNLFGWAHPRTRKIHLVTISLTLLSWVGLGLFYGFGYCFLTDWHYQVLHRLGHKNLPYSYITFLLERISGTKHDDQLVTDATLWTFVVILIITVGIQIHQKISSSETGV